MAIEVEIKSQIPSRAWIENRIRNFKPKLLSSYKQLNHYWERPAMETMQKIGTALKIVDTPSFQELLTAGQKTSLRTRCTYQENPADENHCELIVKYTIGTDSSENGVSRLEFTVPLGMAIEELDKTLTECGAKLQAKWNREGWLYLIENNGIEIQVGFSPGYGWIAEFEKRAVDANEAGVFESEIRAFMEKVGATELAQQKLDKMFAFYNQHWPEYYLTQNIFDSSKF